jgi:hypothetical protein
MEMLASGRPRLHPMSHASLFRTPSFVSHVCIVCMPRPAFTTHSHIGTACFRSTSRVHAGTACTLLRIAHAGDCLCLRLLHIALAPPPTDVHRVTLAVLVNA